jgi:hypothetical protein
MISQGSSPSILDKRACVEFCNFKKEVNGYRSHFLKEKSYILLKISIDKMAMSKFDSVSIFEIEEKIRDSVERKINDLFSAFPMDQNCEKCNPFMIRNDQKPIFIRLSPECVFWQKDGQKLTKITKKDLIIGKAFSGRLAILIKGITISPNAVRMTPMLSICQILAMKDDVKENCWEQCILDDDVEEEVVQQEQQYEHQEFLEDLSHFYLDRPKPTYSPADEPQPEFYTPADTLERVHEKPRLNGYSPEESDDEGLFE